MRHQRLPERNLAADVGGLSTRRVVQTRTPPPTLTNAEKPSSLSRAGLHLLQDSWVGLEPSSDPKRSNQKSDVS